MVEKTVTARDLLAQAEANRHRRGKHKEQDKVRDRHKHVEKTKREHDAALNRYVLWTLSHIERDFAQEGLPPPSEAMAQQRCLGERVEAPDLETIEDFLRFHVSSSHGKIVAQLTSDSAGTFAESFFVGFTRVTGTRTNAEDRSEIYHWVRKTLTAEGLMTNKRREKHFFILQDLTRILLTLSLHPVFAGCVLCFRLFTPVSHPSTATRPPATAHPAGSPHPPAASHPPTAAHPTAPFYPSAASRQANPRATTSQPKGAERLWYVIARQDYPLHEQSSQMY